MLFIFRLNVQQRAWRLKSTSAKERTLQYHPGEKIHGFTVKEVCLLGTARLRFWRKSGVLFTVWTVDMSSYLQVVAVPDLFLTAVKLTHDKTGAQYLHAARDDSNNLFR